MNTTLIIMAAGIGSRFGTGIKQLAKMAPNGEIIMDFSIYDAKEAGFTKVVFVIRKAIEKEFKEVIGNRLSKVMPVEYVYQELEDLPEGYHVPEGRVKPWGTGQAILACKDVVKEPFVIINADDYYGREGFFKIHDYMINEMDTEGDVYDMCMGGFILENTLSENGTVTRGVCEVNPDGTLRDVTETYDIERKGNGIFANDEQGNPVVVDARQYVSMNMWGLPPKFLDALEAGFPEFLDGIKEGDVKAEYLLPKVIDQQIKSGKAHVRVLETRDKWFGVTYKEDKDAVVASIRKLIEDGIYKENLYD